MSTRNSLIDNYNFVKGEEFEDIIDEENPGFIDNLEKEIKEKLIEDKEKLEKYINRSNKKK